MAQRPLVATVDVAGPFQVLQRPLTLALRERRSKPGDPPIAWWKFDDASGNTVANAAETMLEGKIQGQPRWSTGRIQGTALEFDGNGNWMEARDSGDIDFQDGISVSAWFKIRQFDQPSQTLVAKGESWRLQRQGDKGHLEFVVTGPQTSGSSRGKPPVVISKQPVNDSLWHHVAAVYDGKRIALYMDGVEDHTVTASGTLVLNNVPVTVGENDASRGRLFNGWIDDTRVYNRGLSTEEVQALYSNSSK